VVIVDSAICSRRWQQSGDTRYPKQYGVYKRLSFLNKRHEMAFCMLRLLFIKNVYHRLELLKTTSLI
jgi:hypothetical protein